MDGVLLQHVLCQDLELPYGDHRTSRETLKHCIRMNEDKENVETKLRIKHVYLHCNVLRWKQAQDVREHRQWLERAQEADLDQCF